MGGYEELLTSQHYPKLQTICFILATRARPRDYVALVLSSIRSAQKLSEVSFIFTRKELDGIRMSLTEWGLVDDQLCRLAQQVVGEVTTSFDFLIQPGWTSGGDEIGISFMQKFRFRRFGVMKLRSFGEDVAAYRPEA